MSAPIIEGALPEGYVIPPDLPEGTIIKVPRFGGPKVLLPVNPLQEDIKRLQAVWYVPKTLKDAGHAEAVRTHNNTIIKNAVLFAHHGFKVWKNHSFDFGDPPECTCCWSNAEKRASAARRGIEPKKLKHCSSPGKHPTGDGWETMATTEIDILAEEWKGPSGRFNLAVVTGSYNNTFIVDADGPIGLENLRRLDEAGITPPTVAQISGSGGEHRIYRAPPGWDIRNNNSGEFAPKVDTRGENGQIVGPGSLHKSGNYYRWKQGCALGEIEVTEAPLELLRRVYFATKEHRT